MRASAVPVTLALRQSVLVLASTAGSGCSRRVRGPQREVRGSGARVHRVTSRCALVPRNAAHGPRRARRTPATPDPLPLPMVCSGVQHQVLSGLHRLGETAVAGERPRGPGHQGVVCQGRAWLRSRAQGFGRRHRRVRRLQCPCPGHDAAGQGGPGTFRALRAARRGRLGISGQVSRTHNPITPLRHVPPGCHPPAPCGHNFSGRWSGGGGGQVLALVMQMEDKGAADMPAMPCECEQCDSAMAGPQRADASNLCLTCAKAVCPCCFATTGQLTCKACSGGDPQWVLVGRAEGLPPPIADERTGGHPPPDERSVLAACGAALASSAPATPTGRTPRTPGGALSAQQRGCESSLQLWVDLAWAAAQLECIAGRRSEPPHVMAHISSGVRGRGASRLRVEEAKRSALGADRQRPWNIRPELPRQPGRRRSGARCAPQP